MKREIYAKLLEWKSRRDHKPLVLDGARQVGKTWGAPKIIIDEVNDGVFFSESTEYKIALDGDSAIVIGSK